MEEKYTEEYRLHQIVIKEYGTVNGRKNFGVKILGRLNKKLGTIGSSISSNTSTSFLISEAKKAIDNAYLKIENNAKFDRYVTQIHFEGFRSYLKYQSVSEEKIDELATALTSAQIQNEAAKEIANSLINMDIYDEGLANAIEKLADVFRNDFGFSITEVLASYLQKTLQE